MATEITVSIVADFKRNSLKNEQNYLKYTVRKHTRKQNKGAIAREEERSR